MKHELRINSKHKITNSSEETEKLGEEFAKELIGGDIICLYGNLGSGKTTFVKGLAKGLGIKSRIISPTFVLIRQHRINFKFLYHIDLYRLENGEDIKGLGLEDLFKDKNSIIVIEWAEKLGELLPENRIDIFFEILNEEKRKITLKLKYQSAKIKT